MSTRTLALSFVGLVTLATLASTGCSAPAEEADDSEGAVAAAGTPVGLAPAPTTLPPEAVCSDGAPLTPAEVDAALAAKAVGTLEPASKGLVPTLYRQVGTGAAVHWEKIAEGEVRVTGIESTGSDRQRILTSDSMGEMKVYLAAVNATPQVLLSDLLPSSFAWDASRDRFNDPKQSGFLAAACPLTETGDFTCGAFLGPQRIQVYSEGVLQCGLKATLSGNTLSPSCEGSSVGAPAVLRGRISSTCASYHATFDILKNGKITDRVLLTAKGPRS